jgi:hypothetical protein
MIPTDATAQSSRVSVTMSRMVRMPRRVLADEVSRWRRLNSTSDEALERLPSLSFSAGSAARWPQPSLQEARHEEADSPRGACASMRKASDIGADMNHLWPVSR